MPDWNGDGKKDWHDDYVFNETINKPSKKTANQTKHIRSNSGCSIGVAIAIVVIWELINLLASLQILTTVSGLPTQAPVCRTFGLQRLGRGSGPTQS